MKNSEVVSAVVGGTFFAVPYLALSIPLLPSLAIGAAAFAAGELVFKTDVVQTLKESNVSLYETLELAKNQNKHILEMILKIENEDLKKDLSIKYQNDRKMYTASKNDFIKKIIELAYKEK